MATVVGGIRGAIRMSQNKEIELIPCPFCGGDCAMRVNTSTLNGSVNCVECGVLMKRNFKGHKRVEEVLRELMAQEWNRRVYEQN